MALVKMNKVALTFPSLLPKRTFFLRFADWVRQWRLLHSSPSPLPTADGKSPSVVVSMASYPKRFPTLPIVLRSILHQSSPPNTILVWLDCPASSVPADMLEFSRYGVQFRFVSPGLRSHKKWFHALQEFHDSIVITVDDDIAYPFRTLEYLLAAHRDHPDAVCALRCHRIGKNQQSGKTESSNDWYKVPKDDIVEPSHELFATGCWGILYPPRVFDGNAYAFDRDLIVRLALSADDIWLKFMELISDRKVFLKRTKLQMFDIPGTQTQSLAQENCFADDSGFSGNDRAVANLQKFFSWNKRCSHLFSF